MSKTKVRFAPSPTGFLHIGGMRSALFNWLYARKTGGVFLLRMEDTDRERYVPEAVEQIKTSLDWLGLTPDEYAVQSERVETYRKHADTLLEAGKLYRCWCSQERLEGLREKAKKDKKPFKYDRHCLNHPGNPNDDHVLRFLIPNEPTTIGWNDAVRGHMEFAIGELDDFVAVKSDGFPTYNFANVVDDHEMDITHVLRAEEFLSSTPKHLLLYAAFGWQAPVFAHLPQVLGPDGKSKLSKRHGAQSVLEYRDQGFVPEAVINFMALLGWNEGEGNTKEIYNADELAKAFSLERIQKSPAVFDPERLTWLNGVWIRQLPLTELYERCEGFWPKEASRTSQQYRHDVLALLHDRLKTLGELAELTDFFFTEPEVDLDLLNKKSEPSETARILAAAIEALSKLKKGFEAENIEPELRSLANSLGLKTGQIFWPLRVAITGRSEAPGLFETMAVLGKERTLERLKASARLIQV